MGHMNPYFVCPKPDAVLGIPSHGDYADDGHSAPR